MFPCPSERIPPRTRSFDYDNANSKVSRHLQKSKWQRGEWPMRTRSCWDAIHPQNGRRCGLQPTGKAASSAHQFITPSSGGSQASRTSLGHASSHSVGHHQKVTPISLPRNPSPASNHSRHGPQIFDFNTQLSLLNSCNNHSSTAQQHL